MRLLWLSHFVPYPPRGGSFQRTFNLLRHISRKYETTFVALNLAGESKEQLEQYRDEFKKDCAKVEFWNLPLAWRGSRWWIQLAFSPLYRHHYASRSMWSPQLDDRWRQILAGHQGDLVNFETIDLALYFPASNGFRRILNHQNCESAMVKRRAENESNPLKKGYLLNQAGKLARSEREWCPRFDANLAVSELDADLLRSQSPGSHFHVVENGTDTEYFAPSNTQPEPKAIIFAASLRWYPNVSAIQYFGRNIWPLLRQRCPGVRLYLAGRSPAEAIVQIAASDPDIVLIPDPPDIRPFVARGSVFVCPVIEGGGTRLKILDAMAMGIPVVSTRLGCEGLRVTPGENILVADSPQEFADSVLRLMNDQPLRKLLSANGRALVERLYSWKVIAGHLEDAYKCAAGPAEGRGRASGCFMPVGSE